jgi:hypothetical protein
MVLFGDHVSQQKKTLFHIFPIELFLAKFLPVAFGVKKLQIGCVVEDEKVNHFLFLPVFLEIVLLDWN